MFNKISSFSPATVPVEITTSSRMTRQTSFSRTNRGPSLNQPQQKTFLPLQRPHNRSSSSKRNAFPSVEHAIQFHQELSAQNADVKSFHALKDPATLNAAKAILDAHANGDFLKKLILTPPSTSICEKGSIKVIFAPIDRFPECARIYQQKKDQISLLSVGGPAAIDTAVLASLIDTLRTKLSSNTYITRDYFESNVASSASQLHVRHGTALNADPALTGHALLVPFISRAIFGTTLEEIQHPDFRKIDLRLRNLSVDKLRVYAGNEFNWLWQTIRLHLGFMTEHDLNRLESALSQDILHLVEKVSGVQLSSNVHADPKDSISIHVDLTVEGRAATEHENKELKERVGIISAPLTEEEKTFFFGEQKRNIHGATRYHGDGHLNFEAHDRNLALLAQRGGTCFEAEISHVLFAENEKKPSHTRVAGIITKEGRYVYASHVHLSLGYKADFKFETPQQYLTMRDKLNGFENRLGISPPVPRHKITTATGVSINALFDLTANPVLSEIIVKYGTLPQYAVTNSHWTLIAEHGNQALVRITGGGNTGSEEYNPAYFLNLVANTERIFGVDVLKGIISTYGCPRSINARNSTEFAKIAQGLVVSYGKGGTGNTKRHAEAAMTLYMLDPEFEQAAEEFLNQFVSHTGQPLGQAVRKIHDVAHQMGFIDDQQSHVARRLGIDPSLSASERAACGLLLLMVTVGIACGTSAIGVD